MGWDKNHILFSSSKYSETAQLATIEESRIRVPGATGGYKIYLRNSLTGVKLLHKYSYIQPLNFKQYNLGVPEWGTSYHLLNHNTYCLDVDNAWAVQNQRHIFNLLWYIKNKGVYVTADTIEKGELLLNIKVKAFRWLFLQNIFIFLSENNVLHFYSHDPDDIQTHGFKFRCFYAVDEIKTVDCVIQIPDRYNGYIIAGRSQNPNKVLFYNTLTHELNRRHKLKEGCTESVRLWKTYSAYCKKNQLNYYHSIKFN